MRMLKGFLVLIFVGLMFSGANKLNPKIFALEAGGGGGGADFGGEGGGASGSGLGSIGQYGAYAAAAKMAIGALKANCGMGGGPANFGGRVQKMCKCKDGGFIVKIGSPRGGNYYFGKGSIAYLFGALKKGVWTVGNAGGKKVCYDLLDDPKPQSGNYIKMVGSSMF